MYESIHLFHVEAKKFTTDPKIPFQFLKGFHRSTIITAPASCPFHTDSNVQNLNNISEICEFPLPATFDQAVYPSIRKTQTSYFINRYQESKLVCSGSLISTCTRASPQQRKKRFLRTCPDCYNTSGRIKTRVRRNRFILPNVTDPTPLEFLSADPRAIPSTLDSIRPVDPKTDAMKIPSGASIRKGSIAADMSYPGRPPRRSPHIRPLQRFDILCTGLIGPLSRALGVRRRSGREKPSFPFKGGRNG